MWIMEIKDQNIETAVDDEGHEYIAEIDATMTDVSADGTVSVAEMTTTANPDDPTDVEGNMTVTETAPDGTETVTEYVSNDGGVFKVEEESDFENAVEATFGVEIEDDLTQVLDADGNPVGENVEENSDETEIYVAESDSDEINDTDFTDGGEIFTPVDSANTFESDDSFENVDPTFTETPFEAETFDVNYTDLTETSEVDDPLYASSTEVDEVANQEIIEQEAHTNAATEAQQAADDFVESGDYAAAAEARETAENEAWEAGDDSMLGVYDSSDLSNASDKQEDAAYYEKLETEHAQAGDYEAAKEDAGNAAYAMSDADYKAGGADHTGQADSEVTNMDNALWHEGLADDQVENAEWHAEMGNTDAAESSLDAAASEQAIADDFGDQGEHGSIMADYDPSSEVETGGSYESTYDVADLDTGYDAGMDNMSVDTGFDSGVDTTVDTSYDSGTDDV